MMAYCCHIGDVPSTCVPGEEPSLPSAVDDAAVSTEDVRRGALWQPTLTAEVLRLLRAIVMGHCKVISLIQPRSSSPPLAFDGLIPQPEQPTGITKGSSRSSLQQRQSHVAMTQTKTLVLGPSKHKSHHVA